MYPTKLNNIINLFETLPEDERRETLVSYADNAKRQEPREGEKFGRHLRADDVQTKVLRACIAATVAVEARARGG